MPSVWDQNFPLLALPERRCLSCFSLFFRSHNSLLLATPFLRLSPTFLATAQNSRIEDDLPPPLLPAPGPIKIIQAPFHANLLLNSLAIKLVPNTWFLVASPFRLHSSCIVLCMTHHACQSLRLWSALWSKRHALSNPLGWGSKALSQPTCW